MVSIPAVLVLLQRSGRGCWPQSGRCNLLKRLMMKNQSCRLLRYYLQLLRAQQVVDWSLSVLALVSRSGVSSTLE